MVNEAYSLERKSSIERSMDVGALTASVVLELYQNQKEGEELIMLSELQVSFLPKLMQLAGSACVWASGMVYHDSKWRFD